MGACCKGTSAQEPTEFSSIKPIGQAGDPSVEHYIFHNDLEEDLLTPFWPQYIPEVDEIFIVGLKEAMKTSGKLYYECKLGHGMVCPRIGFMRGDFMIGRENRGGLGDDACGWATDGQRMKTWHGGRASSASYDATWHVGDIIGCALDFQAGLMEFSHNGVCNPRANVCFTEAELDGNSLFPALSLGGMFTLHVSRESWQYAPPSEEYEPWIADNSLPNGKISRPYKGFVDREDLDSDLAKEFVGKWMCHVKFKIERTENGGFYYSDNWDKGALVYKKDENMFEMKNGNFILRLIIKRHGTKTALIWWNPGQPERLAMKFNDWAGTSLITKQQTDIFTYSAMYDGQLDNGSLITEVSAKVRVLCSGPPFVNPHTNIPHIPLMPEGVIWDAAVDFFILEKPPAAIAESDIDNHSKYTCLESLVLGLEDGGTALVKGSWMLETIGTTLARRQELPPAALWKPAELVPLLYSRQVHIWAKSYCWWSPEHPDPKGLQRMDKLIKQRFDCKMLPIDDIAAFIDWSSLYQKPRTPAQDQSFKNGLRNVNLWYAHVETTVLMMTQHPDQPSDLINYAERGWPTFEKSVAAMITDSVKVLDLKEFHRKETPKHQGGCTTWVKSVKICRAGRDIPLAPEAFDDVVMETTFSNGSDVDFVKEKYAQTFNEVMSSAKNFDFQSAGWNPDQVARFSFALTHCPVLETLKLNYNTCGDEGAIALAEVMPQCPKIMRLDLIRTGIQKEGAVAIAEALPKCPLMQIIELTDCPIGDDGVIAIAEACPKTESMMQLFLRNTRMTDVSMRAIVDMMEVGVPTLTQLQVLWNPEITQGITQEARQIAKSKNIEFFADLR